MVPEERAYTEQGGYPVSIFPTKILLATDGSEEAQQAARAAGELSKTTGSEVHIAYVLHSLLVEIGGHHLYSEGEARSVLDRAEGEARSVIEDEAARVGASGGKVAETHLRTGQPDKEIVRLSEELGVGTIVIGSRGLGAVRRALMGGISESVVRHAHCPVFVVRGQDGAASRD
jgi:nucleotide-binding universal stress UspA family protein